MQPWQCPRKQRDPTWDGRRGTRPRFPDVVVVVEWTGGESSLAMTSGGIHSPAWGEPLLWWMNPQDPTSTLFALVDATESMERESLDEGIAATLKALDHARGALREVIVPTG